MSTAPFPRPPPAARLDRAVANLADRGAWREAISVVETWRQHGQPSVHAQLREVESFLALHLPDRAWARLQSLPETHDARGRRLALEARMYALRGWADRAREALDEARAHLDPGALAAIASAVAVPPAEIPDDLVADDAPPEEQLEVAIACMASGAHRRARRLLGRLASEGYHARFVDDLLWALDGAYELTLGEVHALCDRWAPLAFPVGEADEPTDQVGLPDRATGDGGRFPSLFEAHVEDAGTGGDDPEITQSTRLEDLVSEDRDDPSEDTQVLRVVVDDLLDDDVALTTDEAGGHAELEGEDLDRIVLTRRRAAVPPPVANPPVRVPNPSPPAYADLDVEPLDGAPEPDGPSATGTTAPPIGRQLLIASVLLGGAGLLMGIGALVYGLGVP